MKPRSFSIVNVIVLLLLVYGISFGAQSQTLQEAPNFWQQLRYGGGIGLSFGDGFFSGTLAPSAIYDLNPQFSMGMGLSGTYNKLKNSYSSTVLGGSLIGLFNPLRELQISAEFEELNVNRRYDYDGADFKDSYWYPALFLGAGYRAGNATIGIRYDVLYDADKSIYADPWAPFVRFYF